MLNNILNVFIAALNLFDNVGATIIIAVSYILYVQLEALPEGQELGRPNMLTLASVVYPVLLSLFFFMKNGSKRLAANFMNNPETGLRPETAEMLYTSALCKARITFGCVALAWMQVAMLWVQQAEGAAYSAGLTILLLMFAGSGIALKYFK